MFVSVYLHDNIAHCTIFFYLLFLVAVDGGLWLESSLLYHALTTRTKIKMEEEKKKEGKGKRQGRKKRKTRRDGKG